MYEAYKYNIKQELEDTFQWLLKNKVDVLRLLTTKEEKEEMKELIQMIQEQQEEGVEQSVG